MDFCRRPVRQAMTERAREDRCVKLFFLERRMERGHEPLIVYSIAKGAMSLDSYTA